MRALARAKLNLLLKVRSRDETGLHPILSLMQSVTWEDVLEVDVAEQDSLEVMGASVPEDEANLVWKAVRRLREASPRQPRVAIRLDKRIPVAAGFGGGSADAAAALLLYGRLADVPTEDLAAMAPEVGSDVPFALVGGLAMVEGRGERVSSVDAEGGYRLAVTVPPFALDTAEVYRSWDRLGEPEGPRVEERHLPPSLRPFAPFTNDLYPAAVALAAELDDWRAELERAWDRPVLLTGSGPALFAFFVSEDEAADALRAAPTGWRARRVVAPTAQGVRIG